MDALLDGMYVRMYRLTLVPRENILQQPWPTKQCRQEHIFRGQSHNEISVILTSYN